MLGGWWSRLGWGYELEIEGKKGGKEGGRGRERKGGMKGEKKRERKGRS